MSTSGKKIDAATVGAVPINDPRLADARTPVPHKTSHKTGSPDALVPSDIGAVDNTDARLTNARTPTAHKASHSTGGSDALTAANVGAVTMGTVWGQRHVIGSQAANSTVNVTLTFPTPAPNTNYTVSATPESVDLRVERIVSRATTGVVLSIRNTSTLAAAGGTIHLLVVLDQ